MCMCVHVYLSICILCLSLSMDMCVSLLVSAFLYMFVCVSVGMCNMFVCVGMSVSNLSLCVWLCVCVWGGCFLKADQPFSAQMIRFVYPISCYLMTALHSQTKCSSLQESLLKHHEIESEIFTLS